MPQAQLQAGATRILYDPARLDVVRPEWLDSRFWRGRDAVLAEFTGRGSALAVETASGRAVLRRYLRGGQVARVSRDLYVFTGYQRSRGFREWRVLARLCEQGLPVPEPLMASCERHGMCYRAGILTRLIPGARSLAEVGAAGEPVDWPALGETLDRFFRAGVVHADLNAQNLLIDEAGDWYVIDFDRARIRPGAVNPEHMLRRLARSLDKLGIAGRPELPGD